VRPTPVKINIEKSGRANRILQRWPYRVFPFLILLVFIFGQVYSAQAQDEEVQHSIRIGPPQTQAFPRVQFYLEAFDNDGNVIRDLTPANVQITENGQMLAPTQVESIQNGLQVIVAINTSTWQLQQKDGASEYLRMREALAGWAAAIPDQTPDDFSLATPDGLLVIRDRMPEQFVQALVDYEPDPQMKPALRSLADALDLATDPLNNPNMKRAIFFVTPPLEGINSALVDDLASRAREVGAKINVWVMLPALDENSTNPLLSLAEQTGGQFHVIRPEDPLPDIESAFDPLRHSFEVRYTSLIRVTGEHQIRVVVKQGELEYSSNTQTFPLSVLPPNPIFLSPPATIQRDWFIPQGETSPVLTPDEVELRILVEFPDQNNRTLQATRLFVNGQLAAENTAAPFDVFQWPLAEHTSPARLMLRVEAEDVLGLTGTSIETPVDILVAVPVKTSLLDNFSESGLIAVGAVTIAGAALTLVLVLTGRRRWGKRHPNDKKRMKDPLTQPVPIRQDDTRPRQERDTAPGGRKANWTPAILQTASWPTPSWPRSTPPAAPARLVALDENEQPITGGIISLSRQELTLGSDPRRATQVLDSPTVDGLHARLYRTEENLFYLADQNSIAGTWVNYAPVTALGARLEHGDLIHIGKVSFRFELTDPSRLSENRIQVIKLER
jgi:hypothetical protein